MPMLDAYIPEGALSEAAEERLLAELTDLLIVNEGADPSNPWCGRSRGCSCTARRRSSSGAPRPPRPVTASSPPCPRASTTPSAARPWWPR